MEQADKNAWSRSHGAYPEELASGARAPPPRWLPPRRCARARRPGGWPPSAPRKSSANGFARTAPWLSR
jgi:hypothetical protein